MIFYGRPQMPAALPWAAGICVGLIKKYRLKESCYCYNFKIGAYYTYYMYHKWVFHGNVQNIPLCHEIASMLFLRAHI